MSGFDISTLVQFNPPSDRCSICLALWPADLDRHTAQFTCPGCDSVYVRRPALVGSGLFTGSGTYPQAAGDFLWSPTYGPIYVPPSPGLETKLGNEPLAHAIDLAKLAGELRDAGAGNPPLRVLMKLLQASRAFIHLTSFSFDEFTLGLLEMAAQTTSVAAVFSGIDPKGIKILEKTPAEAPDLQYRIEGTRYDRRDQNHGKLIVIDGLLAVIGSPNLTRPGWRKAAANMEIVEVVTDISRVTDLNNRYFSPLWMRLRPEPEPRYHLSAWTITTPEASEHPRHEADVEPGDTTEALDQASTDGSESP